MSTIIMFMFAEVSLNDCVTAFDISSISLSLILPWVSLVLLKFVYDQTFALLFVENKVPAGRSWKGTANWSSCLVRSNNKVHLLITSNKRVGHFPGQLYVEAAIFEEYTLAGQLVSEELIEKDKYGFN